MSATVMMERIRQTSPRFKARMAGGIYVFSVLTALFFELFLGGRLGYAANFYDMFKQVNRSISLLAAFSNLVGIAFEALRLNPHGANLAMVFHGIYCLLIGYLIFKSTFLPRVLSALIVFGGLGWLTYVSPPLANHLSPYNLACGLLGEASVFLWLLLMGVNVQRWREQATAAGGVHPHMKAAI
jgi:hypothetical protein